MEGYAKWRMRDVIVKWRYKGKRNIQKRRCFYLNMVKWSLWDVIALSHGEKDVQLLLCSKVQIEQGYM